MTPQRPAPEVDEPSLPTVPLPTFRQPPGSQDPELATEPATSPSDPDQAAGEHEPLSPMSEPPHARTRTSSAGRGDPRVAGRLFAGLLAILSGTAAWVFYRRGRHLRQPTPRQLDDIGQPLGRILVRYLPLDVVGPTLVDATEAAAATHAYLLDGPLVEPVAAAPLVEGEPE